MAELIQLSQVSTKLHDLSLNKRHLELLLRFEVSSTTRFLDMSWKGRG